MYLYQFQCGDVPIVVELIKTLSLEPLEHLKNYLESKHWSNGAVETSRCGGNTYEQDD